MNKTYQVGFYQGVHGDRDVLEDVSDILIAWAAEGSPSRAMYGYTYRLKELVDHNGTLLQGILAKFRHNDLPKIGSPENNQEKDIELEEEEGLIEKNHFLYDKRKQLLVYQHNGHGSTVNQFAEYITQATGITTVFNPVLQPDAMDRLIRGGFKPKKIQLSVARPDDGLLRGHPFNRGLLELMDKANAPQINVTLSVGHTIGEYLAMDLGRAVDELMGQAHVKIARLDTVDDDGNAHPIDLITDRVKDSITVRMLGRYPDSADVFQELTKANRRNRELVRGILGE